MSQPASSFLQCFTGTSTTTPCWFMRQAGRYLPEYRALREKAGGFLNMCYTPELATEITLQPIRRFGMDAAIIFSDILVIPHALGQKLEFVQGFGPKLEPITTLNQCDALQTDNIVPFLAPVYQALRDTRTALSEETALIGFAGAPWTLLCYMLDGHGKNQFGTTRGAIYEKPELGETLMALLTDAVAMHLVAQIDAGAQAVQLFDSWAAHVPFALRNALLHKPAQHIVATVREKHPNVPILCFPRGIGELGYAAYAKAVQPDGLSIDHHADMAWLAEHLPDNIVLQGNMDPLQLVHDSKGVNAHALYIINTMKQHKRRYIANLGHGVVPPTPPGHVASLIQTIRSQS